MCTPPSIFAAAPDSHHPTVPPRQGCFVGFLPTRRFSFPGRVLTRRAAQVPLLSAALHRLHVISCGKLFRVAAYTRRIKDCFYGNNSGAGAGAAPLGGHLVLRLAVDGLAAGIGGGDVDEGGFVGEAAEALGGGGEVDLRQIPPRRVGLAEAALDDGVFSESTAAPYSWPRCRWLLGEVSRLSPAVPG